MNDPTMQEPPVLVARVDRKKLYFVLGAGLCAYAVLFFFASRFELVLYTFAMAIGVAYGAKELLTKKTRIVVDRNGVLDTRLGMGAISWLDITNVYVTRPKKQHWDYVCIEVVDKNKYLDRRNLAAKASVKLNAAANKISPFNINTGVLDVGTYELYEAIVASAHYYCERDVTR